MKIDAFFQNQIETYLYLERYVNNGSPSGWHEKHKTSFDTNPFTGKTSFRLLKFEDMDLQSYLIGESNPLFSNVNYAHPDSIESRVLSQSGRSLVETEFLTSPTSGGRTMFIRDNNFPGYLKLTYDIGRIGRVDRQISYKHCLSSYETNQTIKNAIDLGAASSGFGIQLESAAKVSVLQTDKGFYEWGVIFREFRPYPYTQNVGLLVPGFSLFGKDRFAPNDECILIQLIERKKADPYDYLRRLIMMIIDCYWEIVVSCAFHIECHGQNCFFEIDENFDIKRFIVKDMDSVDKDIPLAKYMGLRDKWDSYPVMCFDESVYYYKIRSSYMYDFKLGEYLLSPIIDTVVDKYGIDPTRLYEEVKDHVHKKYLCNLPKDYFPLDGCWYNCDNSERLPGMKRAYYSHENPKFR